MSKTFLTSGLLLAAVFVLLGGCSSASVPCAPPICEPSPCAPCPPPVENICNWPDYGHPETARVVLDQIAHLFLQACNEDPAVLALQVKFDATIARCKSATLTNRDGRHVCHLQSPLPGDELREIQLHAADPAYPPPEVRDGTVLPTTPARHWGTIKQELDLFPTGN